MSKPVEVEFLMKDKLTPGMNKAEREALELRNTVRLLEAELERLRLAGETAAPNLDQSANIAQIHALEKQLEELRGKLKLLQEESESVQVTPADMPNAQRQFNGLHNSIQQMAREMPSLAMGPQMFFLAISNNLPIFTDELARARKEYDELQKSGKKGTPVWKQVLSSLFSWQTAMTTGIMLLVMYGDEIWDWTKNLFSAKKGVDEFNISLKEMTEIEKDGPVCRSTAVTGTFTEAVAPIVWIERLILMSCTPPKYLLPMVILLHGRYMAIAVSVQKVNPFRIRSSPPGHPLHRASAGTGCP